MAITDDLYISLPTLLFLIWIIIWVGGLGIFRLTCHLRKSCNWTRCPYRNHYHPSKTDPGWTETGCEKCPPTPEELEAESRRYDELMALVEKYRKENEAGHSS